MSSKDVTAHSKTVIHPALSYLVISTKQACAMALVAISLAMNCYPLIYTLTVFEDGLL